MTKLISKIKVLSTRLLIYLFAIPAAILGIYPLIFTLISSVKDNSEIFGTMFSLPSIYHFEYYKMAIEYANIFSCIKNSFEISVLATFLVIIIAAFAAYVIARIDIRINNLIMMFFIVGFMLPVHTMLIPLVRIVNTFNGRNNLLTLIILYTTFELPISIFLMVGYMKGISKEIEESAIIDGCGYLRCMTSIILPLSMPIISTVGVITFLYCYNELIFGVIFLTDKTKYTISIGLMSFVGQRSTNYGPIFASIIIAIMPMIIIYMFMQEKVESGLTAGAVKG